MASIYHDIELGETLLEVRFTGHPTWEDDSFSYSYGSIDAVYHLPRYLMVEEVTWNTKLYSEEENRAIELYVDQYYATIAQDIINEYKNSN